MADERETRVTGDEPQGTMGRVQTAGEATSRPLSPSRLPLRAPKERRLGTRQGRGCFQDTRTSVVLQNLPLSGNTLFSSSKILL